LTRPSISIGSCANEKSFGVAPFAGFTATMAESDFSCPCRLLALPMPAATLSTNTQPRRPNTRSPSFRCDPFARVVALDPGRASAPRNDGAAHVAFERMKTLGPRDIDLSRLNPTPPAIAVYASSPLSPAVTQRSLLSGRYPYLGRTSTGWIAPACGWRTHSITSSAGANTLGGTSKPLALAVLMLSTVSYFVGARTGRSAGFSPFRIRSRRRRRQADTTRPVQSRRRSIPFGDETAEVMGSNGAMIVPQDIKPKQTVRQEFDNV
jgi:hypothetical protein